MLFSSGMSFLRVIILALILNLVDFTLYTTIIALGAFLGSFFSFGIVEETYKKYPIWIANGKLGILKNNLIIILRKLFIRYFYIISVVLVVTCLISVEHIQIAVISLSIGFLHSIISVLASTQRAIGDLFAYSISSIFRALIALVLVLMVAWLTDNHTLTLLAELTSMIVGAFIAYNYSNTSLKKLDGNIEFNNSKTIVTKTNKDGLILFICYTILTVPFYLDRSFITLSFNEVPAAQYALFALFLSISFLLINAISQKVSPEIFKIIELTKSHKHAYSYAYKWIFIFVIVWILIVSLIFIAFSLNLVPNGLLKYKLQDNLFLVLVFLGSLSATNLLEFVVIAINKEIKFLKSAAIYLLLLIIVSSITLIFEYSLISFIWLLFLSRFIYLSLLIYYIKPFKFFKLKIN